MKKILALFVSLIVIGNAYAETQQEVLVTDTKADKFGQTNEHDLYPRKYRSSDQALSDPRICRTGLGTLWTSGSSQFNYEQIKRIIDEICLKHGIIPTQIIEVDLRQEHHLFLNGKPISEFSPCFSGNSGKIAGQVLEGEKNLRDRLKRYPILLLHKVKKKHGCTNLGETEIIQEEVDDLATEQEIAERLGICYVRFSVQDHFPPDATTVDQFISFIRTLPANTWLHFHCRGGNGRTSTFMVMYDMIRNHAYLAKEDFFNRQVALGGKDLNKSTKKTKPLRVSAENRRIFIHHFYDYVMATDGYRQQGWSEWLKTHPLKVVH
jgi:protein-tyrosine phosphatase